MTAERCGSGTGRKRWGKNSPPGGSSKTEIFFFTEEQVPPEDTLHIHKYKRPLGFALSEQLADCVVGTAEQGHFGIFVMPSLATKSEVSGVERALIIS